MTSALNAVCCARLPVAELARLGPLRARDDVHVLRDGERLWVFWTAPDRDLAAWLLSLPGVELIQRQADGWRGLGQHLPTFDVPDPHSARTLPTLLSPAPLEPIAPGLALWKPVEVKLVSDEQPRTTTALLVSLAEVVRWADTATSHSLAKVRAARREERLLLRGKLPPLLGERYWGDRVLLPAGWRYEPAVAEGVLAKALHLDAEDVVLLTSTGADVIPGCAFAPVTRAGVRLAAEGNTHAR